jgi:division protein CdvB (Snf7/Vps24/ESCRT-III family)
LKQTETRIGKLATAKKELEERMAVPSVVSDYLLMDKLARELEALEGDIEKEETKWETLAEQLAAMGATV